MTGCGLLVRNAGPGLSLQDNGRTGFVGFGLSVGGAMDATAIAAGAALLRVGDGCAIEIAGAAEFEVSGEGIVIACTGAVMRLTIDDQPAAWNATHSVDDGARLRFQAGGDGTFSYLSVNGVFDVAPVLGSCSTHLTAGVGKAIRSGDRLGIANLQPAESGLCLPDEPDVASQPVRVLPGIQTHLFETATLHRFEATEFRKSVRANRMGAALEYDGDGFSAGDQLSMTSEFVVPGDVQLVGRGDPYILFNECQTTGGYPRIATVISADRPRLAQLRPGVPFRFAFVTLDEALDARRAEQMRLAELGSHIMPLFRDPRDMGDLLSYQLIGGVTAGDTEHD